MNQKFLKPYNPGENEDVMYSAWETSGFFDPDTCIKKGVSGAQAPTFSIVLPPPNVTGTLHLGHASMLAIEDILVRYHRMQGWRTLWIPGTDHAAIATQSKVEELLYKKEEKTRHDLGREAFLEKVEAFAKESHDTIVRQVKKMGASLDWSKEAYTLDEKRGYAVRTAFKRLYDLGLIYRGMRIVNWDPKLQTTVSDDEVDRKEEVANFYYLKYGPFTIATARPETKFGDKYVVMHPDDARYASYEHRQQITVEWINGPITATVIKDAAVDMTFGTGVMTITPWHDPIDFEIAERHGLDKEQIIDMHGKLLPIAGEFAGLHIKKARPKIVEKLQSKGLIERIDEKYTHNVAINSRGGGIIEPQIKEQWFVAVEKPFILEKSAIEGIPSGSQVTLKQLMTHTVRSEAIRIIPDRFEKIYFHWIENLRDWCISRQIWYGHRVPVWYRENGASAHGKVNSGHTTASGQEFFVGLEAPEGEGWEQDPDTLDTWFSSGLWTFSTLGWPENSETLREYHPTTLLETGYDILFFWVARMILMSTALLGEIPFKTAYLHGLVRDAKGQKMSKSLGNIIDPLTMSEKYGADATRLSLIIGTGPGNDSKLSEDKIRGYKNYANKIWNASRFVVETLENAPSGFETAPLTTSDAAELSTWRNLLADVTKDIEEFRLYLAGEKLYHYFWHTFADIVIEQSKPIFKGATDAEKSSRARLLSHILEENLKALHPFMPFVTETIWQTMGKSGLLMVEQWPLKKS